MQRAAPSRAASGFAAHVDAPGDAEAAGEARRATGMEDADLVGEVGPAERLRALLLRHLRPAPRAPLRMPRDTELVRALEAEDRSRRQKVRVPHPAPLDHVAVVRVAAAAVAALRQLVPLSPHAS